MRRKIVYLLFLLVLFVTNIVGVNAATFTSKGSERIYYSGGSKYTYYNKKIDGTVAYCIQMNRRVPSVGASYSSGWSRYKYDALVSAQIIKMGKAKYGTGKTGYLYIQEALNCYKKYSGYYSGACGSSKIKTLISDAKTEVNKYDYVGGSSSSKLPSLTLDATAKTMARDTGADSYISEKVTLSGLVKTFGGSDYETNSPSYTISLTSKVGTAYICSSKAYSSDCKETVTLTDTSDNYEFYIAVRNGGTSGGNVKINVTGTNSSKYPSSYLWVPANSAYQRMVTISSVTIKRTISVSLTLNYSEVDKYTASLEKVDENGEALPGAILTLYTANDANGEDVISELCKFSDGDTSCSNNDLIADEKGYKDGKYLCFKEDSSPNGYKSVSTKCSKITFGEKTIDYFVGQDRITKEVYDKYNGAKSYCIINANEDNFSDDYIRDVISQGLDGNSNLTLGSCESIDEDTTNPGNGGNRVDDGDGLTGTSLFGKAARILLIRDDDGDGIDDGDDGDWEDVGFDDDCEGLDCDSDSDDGDDEPVVPGDGTDGNDTGGGNETGGGTTGGNESGGGNSTGGDDVDPSTTSGYKKSICIAGDGSYDADGTYCSEHAELVKLNNLNGDYSFTVVNALNSISISKKSITGTNEVPGAVLAIYTTDGSGNCSSTLAKAKGFRYQSYKYVPNEDDLNTNDSDDGEMSGESDSGDSEENDTGESETSGTDDSDDGVSVTDGLKWTSSYSEAIISGLDVGTYCLVEEIAPAGYKKVTTTTKFSMSASGDVALVDDGNGAIELSDNDEGNTSKTITFYNEIMNVSISKTDVATSKELPGARISICDAGKDENGKYEMALNNDGDCSVTSLANGSLATWISTNEPHKIYGLGAGTYFLVEEIAPEGYSTAESILFVVKEDGTLTDINGKSLADNKLVMADKKIPDVKTGMLWLYITMLLGAGGFIAWNKFYKKKQLNNSIEA